jgi:predicted metal-dependent HD superfamily phosphohydrolase
MLGASEQDVDEVARLILLTKGHTVPSGDRLGALMVSIDLSILGADEEAYDAYAHGVREEYTHVPEAAFRAGRKAVMQKFLEAPTLYPDQAFQDRLEARARANIAREIATL